MPQPDSNYEVNTQDQPVGARESDLTVDQVHDVLAGFDAHWPGAIDSLAQAGRPPMPPGCGE